MTISKEDNRDLHIGDATINRGEVPPFAVIRETLSMSQMYRYPCIDLDHFPRLIRIINSANELGTCLYLRYRRVAAETKLEFWSEGNP